MKRMTILLGIAVLCCGTAMSQPYDHSAGVRAGFSSGLAYKRFIDRNMNIDVQALYNREGFQLTALYEYQFSPYSKKRLYYYAGIGPHGGNWGNELAVGAAVLAGTEFVFRKAPVIVGLEWKPMVNFYKVFDHVLYDVALTARVVL